MTIDQAISYNEHWAKLCKLMPDCDDAVGKHQQYATWLRELKELREKNAELQEEVRLASRISKDNLVVSIDHERVLNDENDKLRKLALCLLTCAGDDVSACDKCPLCGGPGEWKLTSYCDGLLDLVHELVIEVQQ